MTAEKENQEPDGISRCQLQEVIQRAEQVRPDSNKCTRESRQEWLFEFLAYGSRGVAGSWMKVVNVRELPEPLRHSCGLRL